MTAPSGQLFKGKFYYCEGSDTRNITTKAECHAAHYRWVRRKYNFDNLGQVGMDVTQCDCGVNCGCGGHGYNPTPPVTLTLLHRR